MELSDTGLHEQPFRTHGRPSAVLEYAAHRNAVDYLRATYEHKHGLGLLQGPTLAGKTTVATEFLKGFPGDVSRALIDGAGLTGTQLLSSVLNQFGYKVELTSANELLSMLRVFRDAANGRRTCTGYCRRKHPGPTRRDAAGPR